MRAVSLFTGIGGTELALEPLGFEFVAHVEFDNYASQVLLQHWPNTPNLGDITKIDWGGFQATYGKVDLITGGFPCQDISYAGKGAGIAEGTRSGLWYEYANAISALRPRYVWVENVQAIFTRGIDLVLGTLASLGYDTRWGVVRASDAGMPHGRPRWFCLAVDPNQQPGNEWWQSAPGQTESRGPRTDAGRSVGAPPSDTDSERWDGWSGTSQERSGRGQSQNRSDQVAAYANYSTNDRQRPRSESGDGSQVDWGDYEIAVRKWEALTRAAPPPTNERGRLSARFVEWMQGFPDGWVTDSGISRPQQLKCLGNAVGPAQVSLAWWMLKGPIPQCHATPVESEGQIG